VARSHNEWAQVTLRLFGDALPLEKVSARLDLPIKKAGRKGEKMTDHPRSGRNKTSFWLWSATSMRQAPLENQLTMACDVLEPRLSRLRRLVRDTGARAELFIGFGSADGQGSARVSQELLRRLAKIGLPLQFDLYP
jgi:hypothetical protein